MKLLTYLPAQLNPWRTELSSDLSSELSTELSTERTLEPPNPQNLPTPRGYPDTPGKPLRRGLVQRTALWLTTSLPLLSGALQADTLANANALFAYAETNFSDLLQPANPETQVLQGFYVRHYTETQIYLGVQGDNVWALGEQLGPDLIYVGKLAAVMGSTPDAVDISDALLSNRRPECSYYAENLTSAVSDLKRGLSFTGNVAISVAADSSECVITANSIPNHDFNDASAAFATNVSAVDAEFRIPLNPAFASSPTAISLTTDTGILLNGVKIDLLAAACYNVGDERIGCNDMDQPWRFDPMSPLTQFGTDSHNAHTQPDGTYHYHGNPLALFDQQGASESPLIGFAADGFPIFGSYINDNGAIRAVTSSYQLKTGSRPQSANDPGGTYDGTFVDDYHYVAGSGDLDECNGMMRNGAYGYYIVNQYPWVLACFKGTPNTSFNKSVGSGNSQMGPPGGM